MCQNDDKSALRGPSRLWHGSETRFGPRTNSDTQGSDFSRFAQRCYSCECKLINLLKESVPTLRETQPGAIRVIGMGRGNPLSQSTSKRKAGHSSRTKRSRSSRNLVVGRPSGMPLVMECSLLLRRKTEGRGSHISDVARNRTIGSLRPVWPLKRSLTIAAVCQPRFAANTACRRRARSEIVAKPRGRRDCMLS